MNSVESLNSLIYKFSLEYSDRVKEIVHQAELSKPPTFNTQQLEELKQIKIQLHLLFETRDNCLALYKQIESN